MRNILAFLGILGLHAVAPVGAAPMRVANPLLLMSYLQGSWTCASAMNGKRYTYRETFAYVLNHNWIEERDSYSDGGGDQLLVTYLAAKKEWRAVVNDSDRTTVVFEAPDTGLAHIAFVSVYPDRSMQEVFDRVSMTKYTTRFRQKTARGIVNAADTCTKN